MERDDEIEVRALDGVGREVITGAFLEAFADYGLSLDEESLWDMLRRRGVRLDLSFGAFDAGRLVSFIINGIGEHGGRMTAYDTGTGTSPAYRGRGLTDRIFGWSLPVLRAAGVGQYLLEVLCDNHPAVKIYRRQGFETLREFVCFGGRRAEVEVSITRRLEAPVEIRRISVAELIGFGESLLAGFMDYDPSWQNSLDSLRRNEQAFVCFAAFDGEGEPVGFIASEVAYGDISLLAVDRRIRRRGVGSALMAALLPEVEFPRLKALNVDSRDVAMQAFLHSCGMAPTVEQFEMLLPL